MDSSEYDKGVDQAGGKLSGLGSKLKSGAGKIAKLSAGAIAGATTAVTALTKASLDGYANYEQMVGGVQKLYGNMGMSLEDYAKSVGKSTDEVQSEWSRLETAQNTVLENAKNAYKTAGMSANQYMELATSFSASLINSLGGDSQKAAEQTDVAMRAISDNWNTFGGDLQNVQNAYQGFAKQNYTMLDNLKLGYGGTKNEMQRLVEDANLYAQSIGQAGNLSMDSFSDIVTAIDLIQQKQNIAGTTAREASTTIEGSINAVKSAWQNLVTGFADPDADLSTLMENVVTTGTTALGNIIPTISKAVEGIGRAVTQILPKITDGIPKTVDTLIIPLTKTGFKIFQSVVTGLVKSLPNLVSALFKAIPKVFSEFSSMLSNVDFGFIDKLAQGLDQGLPKLLEKVLPMLVSLTDKIRENAGKLISAGLDLIVHLAQGIANSLPVLIENVPQIITNIANIINENAPKLLVAGIKIIGILALGIIKAIPTLIANIPKIFEAIFAVWSALNWVNLGKSAVAMIKNGFNYLKTAIPQALRNIGENAKNAFRSINWQMVGANAVTLIKNGVVALAKLVPLALKNIARVAVFTVRNINWIAVGKFIVQGIVKGITFVPGIIANALLKVVKNGYEKVKSYLGIASPSKLFRKEIGVNIGKGTALGIQDTFPQIARTMSDLDGMLAVPTATAGYSTPATADDVLSAMDSGYVVDVQNNGDSPRTIDATMEVNGVVFARLIYDMWQNEARRRGVNIEGVYA